MPPARRFRDDVEVKSFPRRAVAVPSVPSALSFFFCLLRRRRRHRHVQSTLSLSLSLEHTRKSRASSSSVVGKRVVVGVVVVGGGGVPSRVCPSRERKSPRRSRVSLKEEQKVMYNSENPKPYTPIFRVLNRKQKVFSRLFLRKEHTQTKAVPNRCSPPPARRAHHH